MRYPAPVFALVAPVLAGCGGDWPEPTPIATETLLAEHEEWRAYREGRLVTPPGGAVLWMGLWDLPPGSVWFGSGESLPIRLPAEDAPPLAGTLRREGQTVMLEPAPGSNIRLRTGDPAEGDAVERTVTEPTMLENDRSDEPTTVLVGSLGLRVHSEPGTDRLWVRAWDEDSPQRETFRLPPYYPVSDDWRVAARFEPYDEPQTLRVPDVRGGTVEYRVPGELRFQVGGEEHALVATAGETSSSFFVMMWDSTATVNTYQAGRYLRVELPDDDGWTEIDFNRAYNAPCVFTPHSVCALPPRPNWLALHVTAGEQRPDPPFYQEPGS
jgi:hypothetical protein